MSNIGDSTKNDVKRLENKVDRIIEDQHKQSKLLAQIDERLNGEARVNELKLISINARVTKAEEKIDIMSTYEVPSQLESHETRITSLESIHSRIVWIILTAILMALLSLILIQG